MSSMIGRVLFVLFGMGATGVGFYIWWSHAETKRVCTTQTAGIVKSVNHEVKYNSKSRRNENEYRTTFAYSVNGVEYVEKSIYVRSTPLFSEGDKVTIFHDPADPERFYALEEENSSMIKLAFFLIAFGAAFILIGFLSPHLVLRFGSRNV